MWKYLPFRKAQLQDSFEEYTLIRKIKCKKYLKHPEFLMFFTMNALKCFSSPVTDNNLLKYFTKHVLQLHRKKKLDS